MNRVVNYKITFCISKIFNELILIIANNTLVAKAEHLEHVEKQNKREHPKGKEAKAEHLRKTVYR